MQGLSSRDTYNFRNRSEMANTAQARKRARQAEVTRQRNASQKSALRTAVKKVKQAIATGAGDQGARLAAFEYQYDQGVPRGALIVSGNHRCGLQTRETDNRARPTPGIPITSWNRPRHATP